MDLIFIELYQHNASLASFMDFQWGAGTVGCDVLYTVARARGGVRPHPGITASSLYLRWGTPRASPGFILTPPRDITPAWLHLTPPGDTWCGTLSKRVIERLSKAVERFLNKRCRRGCQNRTTCCVVWNFVIYGRKRRFRGTGVCTSVRFECT